MTNRREDENAVAVKKKGQKGGHPHDESDKKNRRNKTKAL